MRLPADEAAAACAGEWRQPSRIQPRHLQANAQEPTSHCSLTVLQS